MEQKPPTLRLAGTATRIGEPASKVLIVYDEPYVRDILSRWLDSEGYNCHIAESAEEAWKLLESNSFSLLVADIIMPGKSGIELLKMAKEDFPDLAVIMVTGLDDRKTAIRALQLGAYGYVIKPFEQTEVVINVVNALERRRLTQESRHYERRLEEKVREQTEETRSSREEIALKLMAALEYRDDETGGHIRRVGLYAEVIGRRMGHTEEYNELLRLSAPMHDIGKMGIPDSILMKPAKLTAEEFEIVKTHTTIGANILAGTAIPLLNLAREIAYGHHEKWDGSGYPKGISGDNTPEAARIAAVADVYDALVHDRVYRLAMPEDDALEIMSQGRGTHFDPEVLDVFMESLPEFHSIREEIGRELT